MVHSAVLGQENFIKKVKMLIVPGMSWSWAPIEFGYDFDVGRIYG